MIRTLNKNFIPVVDNVSLSQRRQDERGEFFRKIAEQGHYRGRTTPTDTRQGLYAATASGELLTSANTTSAGRTLRLLNDALRLWANEEAVSRKPAVAETYEADKNFVTEIPEDGMVLREIIRDLPRNLLRQPDFTSMNVDHVWLTRDEVKGLLPENPEEGVSAKVDKKIAQRLARFHFLDSVRGESDPYLPEHVKRVDLTMKVVRVSDDAIEFEIEGKCLVKRPPTGELNPYSGRRVAKEMGVAMLLAGQATFDRKKSKFVKFDFLAAGNRWGGTTYNFRDNDLEAAPMGFAFQLVPTDAKDLTPPKFVGWKYFE